MGKTPGNGWLESRSERKGSERRYPSKMELAAVFGALGESLGIEVLPAAQPYCIFRSRNTPPVATANSAAALA